LKTNDNLGQNVAYLTGFWANAADILDCGAAVLLLGEVVLLLQCTVSFHADLVLNPLV
jgi:hypothetical protein